MSGSPPPSRAVSAPRWVDHPQALMELVQDLSTANQVAVDTESDGFFRYRARICLIQLATQHHVALVDGLAPMSLEPLFNLLRQERVECVLHDAEQDVMQLRREHGVILGRVFDTAAAARICGIRQVGLANLAQSMLGVHLDKREQKSNWSHRPLRPQQLEYAARDVAHLLAIRQRLQEQLEAVGRARQAEQEFERIRQRVIAEKPFDPEGWRNLPEARGLDPVGRGVLRAVWNLREHLAEAQDLAPFRIMLPLVLVELARRRPQSAEQLASIPGLSQRLKEEPFAEQLLGAVQEATPVHGPLKPPRPPASPSEHEQEARYETLRSWRTEVAQSWNVDVGVVASNALLMALARSRPRTLEELARVPDILPWRVERFGPALLSILAMDVTPVPVDATTG